MADISMDYTSMASMQSQVQTKLDNLEDMLDTMDRLVSASEKNWRGHGHKKFTESFKKIEADLRTVCECLEKYVSAIQKAQTDMEDTDSDLAASAEKVAITGGVAGGGGSGSRGGGGSTGGR